MFKFSYCMCAYYYFYLIATLMYNVVMIILFINFLPCKCDLQGLGEPAISTYSNYMCMNIFHPKQLKTIRSAGQFLSLKYVQATMGLMRGFKTSWLVTTHKHPLYFNFCMWSMTHGENSKQPLSKYTVLKYLVFHWCS